MILDEGRLGEQVDGFDVAKFVVSYAPAAEARRRLPVEVIDDDDCGEVRDDGQVVHADEQRREDSERRDAEERREGAQTERDGRRDGREEHGDAGLAVAVREAVGERRVGELLGEFPRVEEDERVVGSDGQDDEDGEHVEGAEVAIVEDDAVEEVGGAERGDDAEHGQAGDEQCAGLRQHEDEDEAKATDGQLQIGHHLRVDLVEEQRQAVIEEVHLADSLVEDLLQRGHVLGDDELFDLLVLSVAALVGVLVAGQRLTEQYDDTCDRRLRLCRRNHGLLAEEALQRFRRKRLHGVQHRGYVGEIRSVRCREHVLVFFEEIYNGIRLDALVVFHVAERFDVLLVFRE